MTGLPYIPVYARDVYTWIMGKAVMACHRLGAGADGGFCGGAAVMRLRGYPDEHISSGLERDHTEFELGDGDSRASMVSSGSICSMPLGARPRSPV